MDEASKSARAFAKPHKNEKRSFSCLRPSREEWRRWRRIKTHYKFIYYTEQRTNYTYVNQFIFVLLRCFTWNIISRRRFLFVNDQFYSFFFFFRGVKYTSSLLYTNPTTKAQLNFDRIFTTNFLRVYFVQQIRRLMWKIIRKSVCDDAIENIKIQSYKNLHNSGRSRTFAVYSTYIYIRCSI